ncbi:ferritin-like domain-containing protein [Halococcus hamelinensis]|uniref:Ferritin Dps family protein n=1 Tax=Halococcus hamelinensis 100A6 TaxID=1132509 RepID=M0M316_9EURY|nr:ferritin-like domain-containing protein [Halococcus hamelinensis]EMA38795.1 Ferritin Dps family protein [Halococcus hamelinensis 100A6]
MTSDEVVDLLRTAYNDEIETVMNYLTNATILDGVAAEEVKDSLRTDATEEELLHAERIGERLKELDAQPPASFEFEPHQENLQPPEDTADVLSVIDGVIEYEEAAIDIYRSLISAAREADDPVTEDLAVTLLSDEESHRAEFRSFRKGYKE